MQFFLHTNEVTGQSPSEITITGVDLGSLHPTSLHDEPVFTLFPIEIAKISTGGNKADTYSKAELFTIVSGLFGVGGDGVKSAGAKTVGGTKKEDAAKFLLDPRRIELIKYNNLLLQRKQASAATKGKSAATKGKSAATKSASIVSAKGKK